MKHCTHCGALFASENSWPKHCTSCGKTTWKNPAPIAILLIPCDDGLIGIRRQNTVQSGRISPPGGFVTLGESWQEAAARETKEEANIDIDPKTITLYDAVSTPDGEMVLIFGLAPEIPKSQLPAFIPNHEASERVIIKRGDPLAFPLHKMITDRYLNKLYQKKQST